MGSAGTLNATAGTFVLTVTNTCGFTPTGTTVNVVTTSTTVYNSDAGAATTEAAFFTAVATTPTVALQGTYDSTSNTFTATSVSITDHANDGGWETSPHNFRPGDNRSNWGHGVIGGGSPGSSGPP